VFGDAAGCEGACYCAGAFGGASGQYSGCAIRMGLCWMGGVELDVAKEVDGVEDDVRNRLFSDGRSSDSLWILAFRI